MKVVNRKAAVSGKFYSDDKAQLQNDLKMLFNDAKLSNTHNVL